MPAATITSTWDEIIPSIKVWGYEGSLMPLMPTFGGDLYLRALRYYETYEFALHLAETGMSVTFGGTQVSLAYGPGYNYLVWTVSQGEHAVPRLSMDDVKALDTTS